MPNSASQSLEEIVIIRHQGKTPHIASPAYVAPNAAICGDVTVGEHCRIMHGAKIIAEGGAIAIGPECIVMENAVLRSSMRHSLSIGSNCLIGPNAHVVGCQVGDLPLLLPFQVILIGMAPKKSRLPISTPQ
jgi:carbonic anhydrase/acetyltransferase-like protein (isoleucine patch superfamily)